jgi:DNA-binding MurR/RpiR family transcriptional regulator
MIIARIEQEKTALRRSELRVAEFVIARPSIAVDLSIADLADAVGVSEPTVIRFCRAVGCVGFQDLKRQLARDLERRRAALQRPAGDAGERSESWAALLHGHVVGALGEAGRAIDEAAFETAVDLMCNATRILVWSPRGDASDGPALAQGLRALGLDCEACPPGPVSEPGTLVIALDGAGGGGSAGWGPIVARAKAAGARVVGINVGGPDGSEAPRAGAECDASLRWGAPGLAGRLAELCGLETLRVAVEARLNPDAAFAQAAAHNLQSRKEQAYAAARLKDRLLDGGERDRAAIVRDLH